MGWATSWCCSGYGYVLSLVLNQKNMVLISVIIAILMGVFLSVGGYWGRHAKVAAAAVAVVVVVVVVVANPLHCCDVLLL